MTRHSQISPTPRPSPGIEHKHVAFGLALVLDELARHVRDLRPEVRAQAVQGGRMLLGE